MENPDLATVLEFMSALEAFQMFRVMLESWTLSVALHDKVLAGPGIDAPEDGEIRTTSGKVVSAVDMEK